MNDGRYLKKMLNCIPGKLRKRGWSRKNWRVCLICSLKLGICGKVAGVERRLCKLENAIMKLYEIADTKKKPHAASCITSTVVTVVKTAMTLVILTRRGEEGSITMHK